MDVGKLEITVDLNADDLAAEITKAVEKQLEPVLAKIREQINATARDLNKIDGKKFIEVAVDAKAAQKAVDEQGRASAKAAAENEANAKALRDLAKAEAEFAAAQKSGDLVARSMAMSKLTQAMSDYEKATGRSATESRNFADNEVKNLDKTAQATARRSTVSARAAEKQVANHKAIQDAFAKTMRASDDYAAKAVANEQRIQDAVEKTAAARKKAAEEARAMRAPRGGGAGGGGGSGGGGGGGRGGGSGGRPDEGYYSQSHYHNFVVRAAMSPLGANAIGLGLAGIPAATLAVTNFTAAIGQLMQSGLALPGIFAGVGASIGTLAVGLSGMKKSITDLVTAINADDPKAMQKATEDMKDMAPAARDTAVAIAQLTTGPLKQLKQQVQGTMFAGVADEIKQLSGTLIPHLTSDMNNMASAWNKTFKTLGAAAGNSGNLSLMDQIFGNTAQAQQRANAAIQPLTDGMGKLAAEGTNFLPRLADGLTKVSMRFDAFINKSVQNGNLDKWISDGLSGMTKLGNAAINFGKTLEGIFKAAGGGDGFLTWLEKATQRWAQFTNSTKGQNQLGEFFKSAREDMARWEPVLGNIFKIIGQIIGGAQAWSAVMLPFLQSATSLLLHMPTLISDITIAFLAWRTVSGIESVLSLIGRVNRTLDETPAKAARAGAAIAAVDEESALGGGGVGGAGGTGGARRGRGGRLGRLGMGAASVGGFVGLDQLMQGVDPGNTSGRGVGGWLQAIGGGALTGGSVGAMGGPETAAIGAVIGAAGAALTKGIETIFAEAPKPGALVPGALQGQDYQNALHQQVMPGGPGGAPWNQQLVDQAFYGSNGSFDPRTSPYASMQKGDANYQTVLTEMQKPGGAFSSIPGLTADNAPQVLDQVIKQAHDAGSALDKLSGDITDLPTGEVVLTDPTPEIIQRVKDLGGLVHSLPSGLIAIDTTQLNAAEHTADQLADTLTKIHRGDSSAPGALPAAAPGTGSGSLSPLFPGVPGRASGGIIRHFDDGGQSPWRTLGTLGASFIDDAAVAGLNVGSKMLGGAGGALSTAAGVAGKVITPLSFIAPELMDAWHPQASTSASDTTALNRGKALPNSSFAGMLPGFTPGADTTSLPLFGGGKYALSGGEGVVIPEAMAALGPDWLYGVNSAFRPGLPKGNYASGGILGRFAPGGGGKGPVMPFDPFRVGSSVDSPNNSTENLLENIRNLLSGSSYGPLTQMQYSNQIQQQYLQQIASGGTLPGTLAPGTTPGHVGPFGTPVAPINKPEAMIRGAISALGGNPDIIMGPDSVKYGQQQSETIKSALKEASSQPGGVAALGRPTDPAAYTDVLTKFAQTGVITPDMAGMGLTPTSPIIGALQEARMSKGPERNQIPAYIAQSLGPGGYTGPLTDENKSILGALGTFRDTTQTQGLQRQQLNTALSAVPGIGGIAGLPAYLTQHPEVAAMVPGLAPGGIGMPGAGGPLAFGGGGSGFDWDMVAAAESGQAGVRGSANWGNKDTGGNGHLGGLQFSPSTWAQFGGLEFAPSPELATPDQQKQVADRTAFSGYNGQAPQGLGAWQTITEGKVPGITTASRPPGMIPAAAPPGGYPQMPPLTLPAGGPGQPAPIDVPPGTPTLWPGGPAAAPTIPGLPVAPPAPAGGIPGLLLPGIAGLPPGAQPPPGSAVVGTQLPPPLLDMWNKMHPGIPAPIPKAGAMTPDNPFALPTAPTGAPPPPAPVGVPGVPPRPFGPAPAGQTWDYDHGKWVSAPGSAAAPGMPPPAPPVAPGAVAAPGVPVVPPPILPGFAGAAAIPPMFAVPPGGATTQNKWGTITSPSQLTNLPIPGGAQIASGAPAAILGDFAQWFNSNIEPVTASGGYRSGTPFDQQIGSNHMSGTALDLNPQDFPGASGGRQSGAPASTHFTPQQTAAIRAKLATYGGAINWGEDFGPGSADPMHFDMAPPNTPGVAASYQALGGQPGTYGPTMPGGYSGPGMGGQFGSGGVFGGGGGVVPVMVTNWPGGGAGGFAGGAGGLPGGAGQAAQMALGAAAPVLGAAGNAISGVAGDALNNAPAALQSTFETRAGINAPGVTPVGAADMHDPIQALLASVGINVPNMSRQGAVQLGNAPFEQGGAGTGGASYDAEGRLLSDTTSLYQRTSTDLDAHLVAMKDQIVGATTDVGSKLAKNALTPILQAGISAGMGAIPSAVLAAMGTNIGTAAAVPIANAVDQSGSSSSTASNLGTLPFTAASGIFSGLDTTLAAEGGPMTGGTPGSDSIPVMAMPGEWMLTTDEVNKMGGFAGVQKFTSGLAKSGGLRRMATGGAVASGPANPGTAGTGTATLEGDWWGVSQVPILGALLDVLINIVMAMMGIQITVRDTMNNLGDTFRQFRGDSFKAFDAQGQLLNDTSGLIDRSQTSTEEATAQRVLILTQVLEGVIQYLIDKVAIPLAEAVGQAAISAAASAGGGALNAVAPGAGSAAGAAASALGTASVQIAGQVGTDFVGAAIPAIGSLISTSLTQADTGGLLEDIFGGWGTASSPTAADLTSTSGSLLNTLTGGLAGLLLPLVGLGALAITDNTGPPALFDNGGLASGVGLMPKATIAPERVLSPEMTPAFERLVDALQNGGTMGGQNSTTVHAPITVMGNAEAGQNVRNHLLSLI